MEVVIYLTHCYKCAVRVSDIRDYIGDHNIVAFDFETAPQNMYRKDTKAALDPARAHIVGCSHFAQPHFWGHGGKH